MRYALIMAGGAGTRLWPMSTRELPKQLIPFISDAQQGPRSLLQIAMDRLEGLVPDKRIYICAGEATRRVMLERLPRLSADRFIAEPMGRDTLNAVGLSAAVLQKIDPDATIAVFTADHLIEPIDRFQKIVEQGFAVAEAGPRTLVTFGIEPTHAATGYGYLQLGEPLGTGDSAGDTGAQAQAGAKAVDQFKEKPDAATAETYLAAGPGKYLWNSGMFVWRASAVMAAIEAFAPQNHAKLAALGDAWGTAKYPAKLAQVYPTLKKVSVDFAIMEPASTDERFTVAALPMPLRWLDVGSWPSYMQTLDTDDSGNAAAGCKAVLQDTRGTLVASDDPEHLITTIGCEDLVIIHTAKATLVCPKDQAEQIKALHQRVGEEVGEAYL